MVSPLNRAAHCRSRVSPDRVRRSPVTDEAVVQASGSSIKPVQARIATRILLVEDEDIVRTAMAEMLRGLGYIVTEASSASQAIAAIRAGVDGIVTDYRMPGMNGARMIQELRHSGHVLQRAQNYACCGAQSALTGLVFQGHVASRRVCVTIQQLTCEVRPPPPMRINDHLPVVRCARAARYRGACNARSRAGSAASHPDTRSGH